MTKTVEGIRCNCLPICYFGNPEFWDYFCGNLAECLTFLSNKKLLFLFAMFNKFSKQIFHGERKTFKKES
jgi:hypothetical protein